jgi:hypothetical protein
LVATARWDKLSQYPRAMQARHGAGALDAALGSGNVDTKDVLKK